MVILHKIPLELAVWIFGLAYLALVPPATFSICLFHQLGFHNCPGCGLGHAIYFLFRGSWRASFESHPLGLFALCILLHRIYILCRQLYFHNQKSTT